MDTAAALMAQAFFEHFLARLVLHLTERRIWATIKQSVAQPIVNIVGTAPDAMAKMDTGARQIKELLNEEVNKAIVCFSSSSWALDSDSRLQYPRND
jgi:hypothetical protein